MDQMTQDNMDMGEMADMQRMQEVMQLQQMQEQMEAISKQLEMFQEKRAYIEITVAALEQTLETKEGTEILSPIADGIFLKTKLVDTKTAMVNVGKGVTVEKTIPEVIEMVKGHRIEFDEHILRLEEQMQMISDDLLSRIMKLEMAEVNKGSEE